METVIAPLLVAWKESRFRLAAGLVGGLLAVSSAVRIILLLIQPAVSRNGPVAILAALGAGAVFDLTASLWLAAPLVLYLAIVPERWFRGRVHRAAVPVLAGAAVFAALFVAVVEVFFYLEFNDRFNFVAVDYLLYPTEVVENIWQSYPTGFILGALALVSAAVAVSLRKPVGAAWSRPLSPGQRGGSGLAFAIALAVVTLVTPSSLSHVSEDRALNEIAGNGYVSFWHALLGSDAPYAGLYATRGERKVFSRLHDLLAEPEAEKASFRPGSTRRHIHPSGPRRRLNVVVVLEESFGSEFVGALHPRPVSLTPNYDALTREGLLFTHAYSTGNRTIRALEATTASLPPLPGVSIVRRPQSENLFTLPALLRADGYQTLFVYGGRALFDGMGSYLRANGVDRIVEQKDYPEDAFRTAWGVSDQAIFDRALVEMERMSARQTPFYSLILSVSNHRPYAFPEGGVRWDNSLKGRENAVRYADWALGRFLRQAKERAFFKDTLFVLMGDHGARVYGSAEIPLASYEIPILLYAPGVVPAGARVGTLMSSLDIPPTVLGLLGKDYESAFFGRDVLRLDPSEGRALMTHNNSIALLERSRIAVLGLHRSAELFDVRPDGRFVPLPRPDPAGLQLIEDAISYYTGADSLYRTGGYTMKPPPDKLAAARSARAGRL